MPLKNAHDSGGWRWSADQEMEYANFLGGSGNLIAVTAGANCSKGAKGPEAWRPPDEGYWCRYAVDWTEVKFRWTLTMTEAEAKAVLEMLDTCSNPPEVDVQVATVPTQEEPAPEPEIRAYGTCEEAEGAGEERVQGSKGGGRGFPKEMVPSARDGDGDGVVCEQ